MTMPRFLGTAVTMAVSTIMLVGAITHSPAVQAQSRSRPHKTGLDMRGLENRLRATSAIDPLSKLRLKGQIDELVSQFREAHEAGRSGSVNVLRRPFEQMLNRITGMLGRDPQLAGDIEDSKEAIWEVLADPGKFETEVSRL